MEGEALPGNQKIFNETLNEIIYLKSRASSSSPVSSSRRGESHINKLPIILEKINPNKEDSKQSISSIDITSAEKESILNSVFIADNDINIAIATLQSIFKDHRCFVKDFIAILERFYKQDIILIKFKDNKGNLHKIDVREKTLNGLPISLENIDLIKDGWLPMNSDKLKLTKDSKSFGSEDSKPQDGSPLKPANLETRFNKKEPSTSPSLPLSPKSDQMGAKSFSEEKDRIDILLKWQKLVEACLRSDPKKNFNKITK